MSFERFLHVTEFEGVEKNSYILRRVLNNDPSLLVASYYTP